MRPLLTLVFVLAVTAMAGAATPELATYTVRAVTATDGSATVTATMTITGAAPGVVDIPLGFPGVATVALTDGPAGVTVSARPANGQSALRVTLPADVPEFARITVRFAVAHAFQRTDPAPGERRTLPEGVRVFRHAMVNTEQLTVGRYRVEVVFPDGMRAHAVREALPKPRRSEAGPRARLAAFDGHDGAWLDVATLAQGDTASLQLELVPARRSLIWLIVGLVISALYLVFFRDLVLRRVS
jgi:hypothetical protein